MADFATALAAACTTSVQERCTVHINAQTRLMLVPGTDERVPVTTFLVSDWYSTDATVATVNYAPRARGHCDVEYHG